MVWVEEGQREQLLRPGSLKHTASFSFSCGLELLFIFDPIGYTANSKPNKSIVTGVVSQARGGGGQGSAE